MHKTLEAVQVSSKKIVRGDLKVAFVLISLFLTILSSKPTVYATSLLIFSALSIHAAGREYFRILRIPLIFLLPALAVIALVTHGNVLWKFSFITITEEGINLATEAILRALASFSILSYLILTTTIPEFFSFLKRVGLPKFIVEIAVLIYRSVQVLFDELERMDGAASSRLGYSSRRSFIRTASLLSYSLFLKTLNRAEKLEMSMQARCYSGKMPVKSENSSGWGIALLILIAIAGGWLL